MEASSVTLLILAALALSAIFLSLCLKPTHQHPPKAPPIGGTRRLPPSLPPTAVLAFLLGRLRPSADLMPALRRVFTAYGPIVTLPSGTSRPTIVVAGASLISRALVANGAFFAGRPPALEPRPLITALSAADYGPSWRALRQNLASSVLHPSTVKSYAASRRQVLNSLLDKLLADMGSGGGVVAVRDHFLCAMFTLLAHMVIGERPEGNMVKAVQNAHQVLLTYYNGLAFGLLPKIWELLLPTSLSIHPMLRRTHEQIFLPLISARREMMGMQRQRRQRRSVQSPVNSYIDSLIDILLPEKGGGHRKLDDSEIVTFCCEFLSAGAETTSTALEWIMANITEHQIVQTKLLEEMDRVLSKGGIIEEEDIHKMEYLNAVVMEGLRRHPPAHFLLPHAVSSDVLLEGYSIPSNSVVHFMIGDMGLDDKVWREPLLFNPERFLHGCEHELADLTGSEKIKMMPFGAGRRSCPGQLALALPCSSSSTLWPTWLENSNGMLWRENRSTCRRRQGSLLP